MSQPTRQEIINAHEALNNLLKLASGTSTASAIFNWETVRAALPPKPRPTMAEVEWDDDVHYLAEAESISGLKVVMLHPLTDTQILCLHKTDGTHWTSYCNPEDLTPTGKRYTLTETTND